MTDLPKVCVIIGAGASHDVRGEGTTVYAADYKLPLAKELFDIDQHPNYFSILDRYPGAKVLTQQLAPLLKSGQVGIEQKLTEYSQHPNAQIRAHFKDIPAYLRDLIYEASMRYTPVPSSYVELVIELLAEYPHNVLFVVLNYDDLLEKALTLFDSIYEFQDFPQYIDNTHQAKVVKLHGSVNWFALLSNDPNKGWRDVVNDLETLDHLKEYRLLIKNSHPSVCSERIDKHWSYPILTAPLANKGISDTVCPQSHLEVASEFISSCNKFLIIGTSGLDQDLLTLVDSAISSPMAHYLVHIVDVRQGADDTTNRFKQVVRAFGDVISEVTTFKIGFRGYLKSQHLHSFAKFDSL